MHRTSRSAEQALSSRVEPGPLRRARRPAAGLVAVLALALAASAPAAGSLTGYGPVGPDPATQLGLSAPVLAAEVGGPQGSVVSAELEGGSVTVSRPGGYSTGSQVVSVTDLSGPGVAEALLPAALLADARVVLAVGVGVRAVETAGEQGSSVQGRAARPAAAATTVTEALPVGDAVPGDPGALSVVVRSPSLVGATVVVVDEGTTTTVSEADTMTLDLAGPGAVFALQPAEAPAAGQDGAEQDGAEQDSSGTDAGAAGPGAGASGPAGDGTARTAVMVLGGLAVLSAVIVLVVLVRPAVARGSRIGRRRTVGA